MACMQQGRCTMKEIENKKKKFKQRGRKKKRKLSHCFGV